MSEKNNLFRWVPWIAPVLLILVILFYVASRFLSSGGDTEPVTPPEPPVQTTPEPTGA